MRIVVDARKAPSSLVRELAAVAEANPGDSRCLVEIHTSAGIKGLLLHKRVSAGERLYAAVRKLGWTAVPELED